MSKFPTQISSYLSQRSSHFVARVKSLWTSSWLRPYSGSLSGDSSNQHSSQFGSPSGAAQASSWFSQRLVPCSVHIQATSDQLLAQSVVSQQPVSSQSVLEPVPGSVSVQASARASSWFSQRSVSGQSLSSQRSISIQASSWLSQRSTQFLAQSMFRPLRTTSWSLRGSSQFLAQSMFRPLRTTSWSLRGGHSVARLKPLRTTSWSLRGAGHSVVVTPWWSLRGGHMGNTCTARDGSSFFCLRTSQFRVCRALQESHGAVNLCGVWVVEDGCGAVQRVSLCWLRARAPTDSECVKWKTRGLD